MVAPGEGRRKEIAVSRSGILRLERFRYGSVPKLAIWGRHVKIYKYFIKNLQF